MNRRKVSGARVRGSGERGSALVMALLFLVLLTVIGILAINFSTTGLQVIGGMKQEAILAQTADTGLEQMKTYLWSRHPWNDTSLLSLPADNVPLMGVLDNNLGNYLLTRQNYSVKVNRIEGPDLISVTVTARNAATNQMKEVDAVLHYFAINPDQAGQGAENSNVIN